ncbi:Ig-like domain-containing protein [Neobacillus drentensis]|uniref:Ig-like domain-containing protein n=1 Tax=Neobacillus drentensis TaxID=220684 RepID=UPI002FFEE20B
MKTPFRKRTINLILASTIALTPFAANLAFAPNAVHASGIEDITAVAQSKIYKNLTASDVADIKVAYNNISKANFSTILGNNIINKIDTKMGSGTAIILAKDIAKLLYQTNSSDFSKQLEAFKSAHSQIFTGKLSANDVISILNAFEDNLKVEIIKSYYDEEYTSFDQLVTAAIDDTQKEFSNFDGLYQGLGITVPELLTMKTNLEKAVDPTKMASAALSSGLIRSEGGYVYGASTYTIGNTAPTYSLKVPFMGETLDLKNDVVWKTNNSTIATFTGNKLIAKKAGKVKVVAYYLNQPIITKEITINPDKTAPAVPTVYTVDDNDTVIKGQAEAGSTITVKNSSTTVAIGKTATNRTFSISMKAQKAGSTLYVTAKDASGNVSKVRSIKVLDRTAPATPTVYSVDNNDKTIKGKAEAYSYITIKNGKTTIATGKTSSKGTFSFTIKTAQKAGSTLYVTAKDAAGNVSKAKSTKVLDRIAPAKPRVYYVHSNDKVVKGTAEAGSTIIIKKGSKVIGTGKTSSNGNYSVKIKAQKKGTVISITAKDKSNNSSSPRVISVIGKR